MNYNEKLELLKKELYGTQPTGSPDGYQNQIGTGHFDREKFDKILAMFKEISQCAKEQNPVLNEILGHFTNFAIDTTSLLLAQNSADYDEIVKKLETMF